MMPAGTEFEEVNTEFGLRTGVLFYKEVKKISPQLSVIILTNVSREQLDTEICKGGENRLILHKPDVYPLVFVEEVKKMLKSE